MVSKLQKLLQKVKNNPGQVRFEELDKILTRSGFERRQPRKGSSHYTYIKGASRVTVPYDKPHIKVEYVKAAIETLEGEKNNE